MSRFFPIVDARSLNLSPNPAGASWPNANQAVYIPFSIPFTYQVKRVFWANGTTAAGNSSMAFMSADGGQRLATTGAVANSGASSLQYVNLDFILSPGSYYLAYSNDGTASRVTLLSTISANFGRHMGCYQQASAHPIPSSMTPAQYASACYMYCGFTEGG